MAGERKIKVSKSHAKLLDVNYLLIFNYIANDAINLYCHLDEFKNSNKVPLDFIQFYIKEVSLCKQYETPFLAEFFKLYNNDNERYDVLPKIFAYTYPDFIRKFKDTEPKIFIIDRSKAPNKIYYNLNDDTKMEKTIENLDLIYKYVLNSDELLSVYEIFDNYLAKKDMERVVKEEIKLSFQLDDLEEQSEDDDNLTDNSSTPIKPVTINDIPAEHETKSKSKSKSTNKPVKKRNRNYIVGGVFNIPQKTGKVMQLVIPQYKLPTKYPTSLVKSRVNSLYKCRKFATSAKEIKWLTYYNLVQVAYNPAFIEKRNKIIKKTGRLF